MKKGFTMIELIFVIVILGILSTVALLKLSATRDDADITKALADIRTAVNDFGSYYTTQGHFGKISDMTNVSAFKWSADVNLTDNPKFITHDEECLLFQAGLEGNFTITPVTASPSGTVCKGVLNSPTFKNIAKTYNFGGHGVNP